jgi:hypothetical protein
MSDAEIIEENARAMRREIMARVSIVEHELELIDGEIEDLPKPRDAEIDARLWDASRAAQALRELLLQRGWR